MATQRTTLCPSCETDTLDPNDPYCAYGRDVCRECAMDHLPRQSDYARDRGEPEPAAVRLVLVGRLSA